MKLIHIAAVAVLAVAGLAAPGLVAAAGTPEEAPSSLGPLPAAVAKALAKDVAAELKTGDLAALESRFDDAMKAALPDAKLRRFWLGVIAKGGPLESCAEPRSFLAGEYTLAFTSCTFQKQKSELKLTFRADGRLAGMFLEPEEALRSEWTAPSYVKPATFRESDVKVVSGSVSLPGTLTIPLGDGPFPAVVLVHGSGPQDRDESIGALRPFRDLAQGLASRGIAVLRYEKRTKIYGKEMAAAGEVTIKDEVLDDVLAALGVLRATPGVDRRRLFVAGHSLGALLAPRIAVLDGALAGVVLLASPSRPMSEVVRDQSQWLAAPGASDAQRSAAPAIRKEADALADLYAGRPDPLEGTILGASRSYWLDLRDQRPVDAARSVGLPILVLQGERDYQVTMKDFSGWKKALAGRRNVTFKAYPKLNHLFVAGEGRSSPDEYRKPGHVAAAVVEDVAAFVRGARKKP
ncbi:MAG: alpha/beta fold hydrolase [Acidobacteriota bacterium]|nr:alpha/beta fold hydrolase [Acidobacteriota bacterium]